MKQVLSILALILPLSVKAQQQPYNPVFDDTHVPSIYITLDQADLDLILAAGNEFSDDEYPARFIFSSPTMQDTVENVGFRLRGNTSRVSQKKSFKVSFNTFEQGRKYNGLEKLNLNGEHNDPSIIRSKLSWDLFQEMGLPATRANHVALFVNEEYKGLYINVEHIDEQFLQSRFGNDAGNLYKCLYPADLTYRGPNGDDYNVFSGDRRIYDLKLKDTDAGAYDDLAHLIDIINNSSDNDFPTAIASVLDVNTYLKILAIEVATGSWDGYWFLMNNYYLYSNPQTGLFHFIPFDYDNTFGIDFVGGNWGTRNIYNWGHPSQARPLTERLLNVDTYRDRFTYYLNQLLTHSFNTSQLYPRIDALLDMIAPFAETDTYRTLDYGYDFDAFLTSYTEALGNHVMYGIKPYIETRYHHTLNQLDAEVDVSPIIDVLSIQTMPERPAPEDPVVFSVDIDDEDPALTVVVEYRLDGQDWLSIVLSDDGQNGDQIAGDGTYAGTAPALMGSGIVSYILSARDGSRQTSFAETRTFVAGFPQITLRINELMASNTRTVSDEAGEFDDWVELYNNGAAPVSLDGIFLTDNLTLPDRWPLPAQTIAPGEFLLLWLDGAPDQGPSHAPFRLSAAGESIGLFGRDETSFYPIDTLSFSGLSPDVSFARTTDGNGTFAPTGSPTPGATNQTNVANENELKIQHTTLSTPYPNPFSTQTTFWIDVEQPETIAIELYDLLGRKLAILHNAMLSRGRHQITLSVVDKNIPAGVYYIRMQGRESGDISVQRAVVMGN